MERLTINGMTYTVKRCKYGVYGAINNTRVTGNFATVEILRSHLERV